MNDLLIIGTGLLGTSLGLALRDTGIRVHLDDPSPTALALARDLGAGEPLTPQTRPDLVVVAAPPDVTAEVVIRALRTWPEAVVTDVASVKDAVLTAVAEQTSAAEAARYVGSHPMAGRERSGAVSARGDLFQGRTWVICPHPGVDGQAPARVREVAAAVGAAPVEMGAAEHDHAVAAVSHTPQVAASLVAARLRDLDENAVALAGQGLRDVTRIAESDPMLWTQILAGNAQAVLPVLDALAGDLDAVRAGLRSLVDGPPEGPGARAALAGAIANGQAGHARIPGKHGAPPTAYLSLVVVLPDRPGQLADLFSDIGGAGVNLEDVRLDHVEGADVGLAELWVVPAALEPLQEALSAAGWRVHT